MDERGDIRNFENSESAKLSLFSIISVLSDIPELFFLLTNEYNRVYLIQPGFLKGWFSPPPEKQLLSIKMEDYSEAQNRNVSIGSHLSKMIGFDEKFEEAILEQVDRRMGRWDGWLPFINRKL